MRIWEDNKATYIPVTIQFTNESELERFINIMKYDNKTLEFKQDRDFCNMILELISKL